MTGKPPPILIVTGYSGAGISSALKHLEDMDFEVFDNFPLSLAGALVADSDRNRPLAIGIDTRSRGFSAQSLIKTAEELGAALLFLAADSLVLQKRFTETRRRHPLAKDRPVSYGIEQEREILEPVKETADHVIDTTDLSTHELRQVLKGHFGADSQSRLTVTLMSFGFRYGPPREADIMMDVRFLKNPHWDPVLRPLTGLDSAVGDFIDKDARFESFLKRLQELLGPLLRPYAEEGKSYLTVAIGCTGGRHRSVYTVERLKQWLEKQDIVLNTIHRDIAH